MKWFLYFQGRSLWWACTVRMCLATMWSGATEQHTSPSHRDSQYYLHLFFFSAVGSDFVWCDVSRILPLCFFITQTHTNHPHVCSRAHVETTEIHEVRRVHSRVCYVCVSVSVSAAVVLRLMSCACRGKAAHIWALSNIYCSSVSVCVPLRIQSWASVVRNTPHQCALFASSCSQSVGGAQMHI